ncbi:MAG: aldo/keto reductase [Myxococcota bacterium]
MRKLGDRHVWPVAFGAMNLSLEGRPSRAQAHATLRAAVDAGVLLIDTADVYGEEGAPHHNEALVAEALGDFGGVLATKGGVLRQDGDWIHRGDPSYLREACERSLRALGRSSIPLYQLHAVDRDVPIEESVGELVRLQDEGKVERIGVSNVDASQLERALREAPLVSVQNEASPYVAPSAAVLSRCEVSGLAFLAYAPMGGWRAGKIAHEPLLQEIGRAYDLTPFEVVIAWLLSVSDALIPVAGASSPANARSSARAALTTLSAKDARRLTNHYWGAGYSDAPA